MGLTRDIDLALHLPLRYEDETTLTPLDRARDGDTLQCEGEVIEAASRSAAAGNCWSSCATTTAHC